MSTGHLDLLGSIHDFKEIAVIETFGSLLNFKIQIWPLPTDHLPADRQAPNRLPTPSPYNDMQLPYYTY